MDNLSIVAKLGCYDVIVDNTILDIGTVVKVKCTISEWRQTKQLELKRIHIVRSTADEVKAWQEVVRWKRDVLGKPWVLSKKQLLDLEAAEAEIRRQRRSEERAEEERQRQKVAKKARRAEKMKVFEEKAEKKRRQEEVIMNAGALI